MCRLCGNPCVRVQLWLGFRRRHGHDPDAYWRRNTGSLCLVAMIALGAVLTSGIVLAILLFIAAVAAIAAVAMFLHASKQRQQASAAAAAKVDGTTGGTSPTSNGAADANGGALAPKPNATGATGAGAGVGALSPPSATCGACGRTVIAPGPYTHVFRCACGAIVTAHEGPQGWGDKPPRGGSEPTTTPVTSAARDTADSIVDTSSLVDLVRGQAPRLTTAQLRALSALVATELSLRASRGLGGADTAANHTRAGSGSSAEPDDPRSPPLHGDA